MSETEMQATDKSIYKYTVTLEGVGGEYACIPITAEQATYWSKQGDRALAAHISLKGWEDESVPSEFQLEDFRDQDFLCGVDPDEGVKLIVDDEGGECCLELTSDDEDFGEMLHFSREMGPVDGPPKSPVVMYRSVLKGADVYEVTTNEPFNPALLTFDCAEVSRWGDVIHSIKYEGGEIECIDKVDREKQDPIAVLLEP
jgi:hypothetical protein